MHRRALLLGLTALCLPHKGAAMFARMDTAELVQSSDAIVIGTFHGHGKTRDGTRVGILRVSQSLQGADAGDELYLQVPQPDAPISSSTILFEKGQSGLWFLQRVDGGLFTASHPQRFVDDAQLDAVLAEIRPLLR